MKYHISPQTGRPNQCRAEKRACPVGGEHFDSKEQAQQQIERQLARENSILPAPASKSSQKREEEGAPPRWDDLDEQARREILALIDERQKQRKNDGVAADLLRKLTGRRIGKLLDTEYALETFSSNLECFAHSYNPGCNGCRPPYDDYCRCATYESSLRNLNSRDLASNFLNGFIEEGYLDDGGEFKPIIGRVTALMEQYGLDNANRYTVHASDDYYGQILDRIEINDDGENFRRFHRELTAILG